MTSTAYAREAETCIVAPPPVSLDKAISGVRPSAPDSNEILISSDSARVIKSDITVFEGNVILVHQGRRIHADSASYDRSAARLELKGNVRIESLEGDVFQSAGARLNTDDRVGTLENGDFYFTTNQSRGNARKMMLNEDKSISFESVHFSTCPADRESWSLYFRRLKLDRESDDAIGHHAVFRIHNIPVFYTPYLRFPLGNRRQSGFLIPEFGTNDKTGATFSLPYYFNLAPNRDATITPIWLEQRGIQAKSEFRYLGTTYSGEVELDYLSGDRITGIDRSYSAVHHMYRPLQNLTTTIDYEQVSDPNYFIDLEGSNLDSSPTHLPQQMQVDYRPDGWSINGKMVNYQVLDTTLTPAEIPYRRVPQISLLMDPRFGPAGLSTSLAMQYGQFEHSNAALESATRINIIPGIRYPLHRPWGYLVPGISGHYTAYTNRSTGSDTAVSSAIVTIDTGLNFTRKEVGHSGWRQTLEPRAFYVYSPYVDQSTLPIFDTAAAEFNFDSLFRENRFVGGDRIGDANQLTLALSSRWLDSNDLERLQAHIGQTFYFQDRQVSAALPPSPPETLSQSETMVELAGMWRDHWYARGTWSWDTANGHTGQSRQFVQYQPGPDRIFSLGYRYVSSTGDSVDLSGQWKFGPKWSLFSRLQYDLGSDTNLDSYAGFRYQSCCWAIQAMASRRVDSSGLQVRGFEFRFSLSGLGGGNLSNTRLPLSQSVFSDH